MKILIIGTCGAGKTTLARKLSAAFDIPHLELDAIYWESDWRGVDERTFLSRLEGFAANDRWIIEGDYDLGREFLFSNASHILWLDFPPALMFWRLMKRSLSRLVQSHSLWKGNRETLRGIFFNKDSLVRWFFQSFKRSRELYPVLLSAASQNGAKTLRLRSPNADPQRLFT